MEEKGNPEKGSPTLVGEALGILGSEPGSSSCPPLPHHAVRPYAFPLRWSSLIAAVGSPYIWPLMAYLCPPLFLTSSPPSCQVVIPDCGCRVIMASDGMWDHMSQSKAVQLVRGLDAEPAAAELVRWGGSAGMCGEDACGIT